MHKELPFIPFPILKSSHAQTFLGSLMHLGVDPQSVTRYISMSDGDEIAVEISTPAGWNPQGGLTVLLVHGLCGSHRSTYLVRMTKRLLKRGVRCIRYNMRGCGSGFGRAKYICNVSRSEDFLKVFYTLALDTPYSPFVVVGYSLGGNLVLRSAGVIGKEAKGLIRGIVSISPPVDLFCSAKLLTRSKNTFYHKYFLQILKARIRQRDRLYPNFPRVVFPKNMNVIDFDSICTAPEGGFTDALDYYAKCSSKPLIENIGVDTKILFAEDDPIINAYQLDGMLLPDHIEIYKTKHGGHLGHLSRRKNGGFHWMDQMIEQWILER
ncbi:MAG: alpha/beta fold hydrolase [Chlamydiota bacterium]